MESLDDFARFRRRLHERPAAQTTIRVCSTGCRALGALDVCEALEREIARGVVWPRESGLCARAAMGCVRERSPW